MLASLSAADLRALHVFRTISRCRSFAGAERELDISQSTISAQLSGLERRLGFRLCERGPGGFRLTERGRTTLDAYARLEGAMNEFLQTTSDLSHRVVGTLRLGMLDHTSTDPGFSVVGLVRLFHERAPDVRLEITQEANSDASLAVPVLAAYIQAHPDLKAIGTQHGGITSVLAEVLKKAGKEPGDIIVGGIDLAPATIDGLESGYVSATLDQLLYLQGFMPVVQCVMSKKYKMPGLSLNTGAGTVTPDTIGGLVDLIDEGIR